MQQVITLRKNIQRSQHYTSENVIHLFSEILDFENPEAVLIGDIGNLWNYQINADDI